MRNVLAALPETGDHGFEGLIAAACSQLAGVPFRLVGSGRQFGRDAEGAVSGGAILVEAKRYTTRLSYADLSTKLIEALERSRRHVEVWCAAATVALDAADAGDLRFMGEARGTTVLVLDWTQPVPPLAVLLATAADAVVDWFSRCAPESASEVERDLVSVRAHLLYADQAGALRAEFRGRSLGLASARRLNAAWMQRHLSDASLAVHTFNQVLAPLDPSMRPVPLTRARLEARVRDAIGTWSPDPSVVVLTGAPESGAGGRGDEGVGKTWAAVRSWLTFPDSADRPRPLLLFMASHMWRDGDEKTPMALLARLAAEQTGVATAGASERWQAKLERWLTRSDDAVEQVPAILLVLDGVNERTHHPWPALISALVREACSKALKIVVTTRRGIYERDLAARLGREQQVITVEAFSDEELDHVLEQAGRAPTSVREPLRGFLRNPRVLSVGLDLLDRMDPDEVSVERLLFEYLRRRQEVRSRGGAHTPEQFARMLVHHAREIRERLLDQIPARRAVEFDDRTLHQRLGLPAGSPSVVADLGEIIDSGFIRITDSARGSYALREHGRTLGLGLLVIDELEDAARDEGAKLDQVLTTIVDPIRAIDETALVLLAALDVAAADRSIGDQVVEELLHQVLTLQNIPGGPRTRIFSGLDERTDAFLAVAGRLYGEHARFGRREWMKDALLAARDRPATASRIDRAVRCWLRSWQSEPKAPNLDGYPEEQARRARAHHNEAERRHRQDIADLAAAERAFIDRELIPLPHDYAQRLDELAIPLLAGRSLHDFADDLFAWCVAVSAGWQAGGSLETMYWLRRLDSVGWAATTRAIGAQVAAFLQPDRSRIFQWAIEYALSGSSDPAQARMAEDVWLSEEEGPRRQRTRPAIELPDVDPLDPEAAEPNDGLDELIPRYRAWTEDRGGEPPAVLMRSFDSPFVRARLVLCRFRAAAVAEIHRDLAARCRTIPGVSPTVLANFLRHDTAILAPVTGALIDWLADLRARRDLGFKEVDAPTLLLASVLPHLDAELQFDLHAGQRADAADAFWLGRMFKPMAAKLVGEKLRAVAPTRSPLQARLALIATADAGSGAAAVRQAAREALESMDAILRAAAFRAMTRVGGKDDDARFAATWRRRDDLVDEAQVREDFWGSLWLSRVHGVSDDPTVLRMLNPALRSIALERAGPRVLEAAIDNVIEVLGEADLRGLLPNGLDVDIVRSDDVPSKGDPWGSWHRVGFPIQDEEFEAVDGSRQRVRDMRDFSALRRRLEAAGREVLMYPFTSAALDRAGTRAPAAVERLIERVEGLARTERAALAAVLAHDLGRILSYTCPERATALFALYEAVQPILPEVMPTSGLPRSTLLIWRSAGQSEIVTLRHRRLDAASSDLLIAREVLAAEMAGRHDEIVDYVAERLSGDHPAELARAITVAGFAGSDDGLQHAFADERFRDGFLERVAAAARHNFETARWAVHWHRAAAVAEDPVDVWRFVELASACADARCVLWSDEREGSYLFECLRPTIHGLYEAAARHHNNEHRKTLFGHSKPLHQVGDGLPSHVSDD
ncbi:hypothetical protein [Methylobacterium sp. CCH5-D2]|uniref:hypothetical protein n=1 Tax=Methylobacterium sp. CCH5-D2 TaxID=1768765 RepID=UPI00083232F7|nr:hypothetical protein [Methylobacterium sp. CCH5-D2]